LSRFEKVVLPPDLYVEGRKINAIQKAQKLSMVWMMRLKFVLVRDAALGLHGENFNDHHCTPSSTPHALI
jgi:hypothetical protein